MIHDPGQIGIGEGNSTVGLLPEHIAGRWLSVFAKKESGLRAQIGVSPSVENDTRYIAGRIETGAAEHRRELLANLPLVAAERRCK